MSGFGTQIYVVGVVCVNQRPTVSSFQHFEIFREPQTAVNLAQHQYDWQKLMLIAGKNSALIDSPDPDGERSQVRCARADAMQQDEQLSHRAAFRQQFNTMQYPFSQPFSPPQLSILLDAST